MGWKSVLARGVTSSLNTMLWLCPPASQRTAVCNTNIKLQVDYVSSLLHRYLICSTGHQDFKIFHHEKIEAVLGQNVTLPCTVKSSSTVAIVNIEWRKKQHEDTKLAVYTPVHGLHLFWPNITMQIENNSMGSHLQLYGVTTQDSGIYICHISSFPHGSFRGETVLEIEGKTTAGTR